MEEIRGMGSAGFGGVEGDPTKVVLRRVFASLLDALVVALIVLLVFRGNIATVTDDDMIQWDRGALLLASLLFILNHVGLAGTTGYSLGKAIVGLRIVRRNDGSVPGLLNAFLRSVPWFVPVPIIPFVELGVMVTTKGHRRIGDRLGRTLVVDRGDAGLVLSVPGLPDPPLPAGPPPMPEQIDPAEPIQD